VILFSKLRSNELLHSLAAKVTLYDSTIGSEKDNLRNTLDAIKLTSIVLVAVGDYNLRIVDTFFLHCSLEASLLVHYVDAKNGELLAVELAVQLIQVRNLALAGTTP
jgi:hypothetical protein